MGVDGKSGMIFEPNAPGLYNIASCNLHCIAGYLHSFVRT